MYSVDCGDRLVMYLLIGWAVVVLAGFTLGGMRGAMAAGCLYGGLGLLLLFVKGEQQ